MGDVLIKLVDSSKNTACGQTPFDGNAPRGDEQMPTFSLR